MRSQGGEDTTMALIAGGAKRRAVLEVTVEKVPPVAVAEDTETRDPAPPPTVEVVRVRRAPAGMTMSLSGTAAPATSGLSQAPEEEKGGVGGRFQGLVKRSVQPAEEEGG